VERVVATLVIRDSMPREKVRSRKYEVRSTQAFHFVLRTSDFKLSIRDLGFAANP